MHDLVIRQIAKYLYRENPTLVNLHLINRRFYGLRKIFEKQLAMVTLKLKFQDILPYLTIIFTFLSPHIRHAYQIYNRTRRTNWIEWRCKLLSKSCNYINSGFFNRWHLHLSQECGVTTHLSRSIYGKAFAECMSDIINDPRCWK